jgi:hypothetical protein
MDWFSVCSVRSYSSNLVLSLEQLQWEPPYGPLLQNLEVLVKKPTPAGPLSKPLFCIPLQILPSTLHFWRPSIPPPNVGPTILLFPPHPGSQPPSPVPPPAAPPPPPPPPLPRAHWISLRRRLPPHPLSLSAPPSPSHRDPTVSVTAAAGARAATAAEAEPTEAASATSNAAEGRTRA